MADRDPGPQLRSSSIKFALFDAGRDPLPRKPLWRASRRHRRPTPRFVANDAAARDADAGGERARPCARCASARAASSAPGGRHSSASAHRVVHGGSNSSSRCASTPRCSPTCRATSPLAPLHQPYALQAIDALLAELPGPAAGRLLRYRLPPHACRRRADAAAAALCGSGACAATVSTACPTTTSPGAGRAPRRRRARPHDRRAPGQRRQPVRDAATGRASPPRWASRRWTA